MSQRVTVGRMLHDNTSTVIFRNGAVAMGKVKYRTPLTHSAASWRSGVISNSAWCIATQHVLKNII